MRSEYEEVVIKESVEEVKVGSVEKVKVEVEVKVTKKSRKGKQKVLTGGVQWTTRGVKITPATSTKCAKCDRIRPEVWLNGFWCCWIRLILFSFCSFERAHHCRICNKCVLKYDHHCPVSCNFF